MCACVCVCVCVCACVHACMCLCAYIHVHATYVIVSEKMTLMAQIKNVYFYVGLKLQVCSLFCSLYQAHSVFCCIVMGANTKRCSRTPNEIIASKRKLPLKTLNIRTLM